MALIYRNPEKDLDMTLPLSFVVNPLQNAILLGPGHLTTLQEGSYGIDTDGALIFPNRAAVTPEVDSEILFIRTSGVRYSLIFT